MARRFRRRRPKVTWMFSNGTVVADRELQADFNATPFHVRLSFGPDNDIEHTILPLNPFDLPVEADPAFNFSGNIPQASLSDIIGSEYLVKRIVGNCWASAANVSNPSGLENFYVVFGIGIFVARADGTDVNRPIGGDPALAAGLDANSRSYNPLDAETQREPWMFRRLWVLSPRANPVNTGTVQQATSEGQMAQAFPNTTAGYHGLRTGPFFDVKSVRRVRQDERLWLSVAAMPAPILETPSIVGSYVVNATFDVRILGALRRAQNRSNF